MLIKLNNIQNCEVVNLECVIVVHIWNNFGEITSNIFHGH